jgi:hypothetical protein
MPGINAESGTSSNELDPAGLTSLDDLADALRGLHQRSGELSLRDLERWARKQQQAGRADVRLTRTTVSEVLAGRRLPSRAFLSAFLEACGVVGADVQRPWLEARARIGAHPPGDPEKAPAVRTPDRPVRSRMVAGAAIVAVVTTVVFAVVVVRWDDPFMTTVACVPETCAASGPTLAVVGRASGELPADRVAWVLIRVESVQRWYMGTAITPGADGEWSGQLGVGNRPPQPKDRLFTLCVFLLPAAAVDDLAQRQIAYDGNGVPMEELPTGSSQLDCTTAVRPANS